MSITIIVTSFILFIFRKIKQRHCFLNAIHINIGTISIALFQISNHSPRSGYLGLLVSEIIATSGLILTILFVRHNDEGSVATAVALFITAGYWFTSSTSFANPMVTFSRIFTDTFTGIAPASVPYFLVGQLIGILIAYLIAKKIK